MTKKTVALILIAIALITFVNHQQDHKSVPSFKVEHTSVKM